MDATEETLLLDERPSSESGTRVDGHRVTALKLCRCPIFRMWRMPFTQLPFVTQSLMTRNNMEAMTQRMQTAVG